jgi:3-oxoacyl-[acyl-carrier protein] reductase
VDTDSYIDKTVLVTGSRKGLGRSLAQHFLDLDATVIGLSRQSGTIDHPRYSHYQCDVRDVDALQTAFRTIGATSELNVVVNNAGVLDSQHSILLRASSAEEMLMTNLLGSFLVSREAAKIMKRSGSGRIINISSMAAVLEPIGDSIYAACKAGLTTMTNVMAREFASFGITCNTLGVTAIETEMLSQIPRDKINAIIANLPLPRYAEEDDVFNVVDFFASSRSSYITAQTIYLGGIHG